jgi:methylenetetrahydrofolate reductase (NADPH)
VGAACYPEGHIGCDSLDKDIYHLRLKQEAGADFLITQLFFDNEDFFEFIKKIRAAGVTLPVSAGVMPILSRAQVEKMIYMCGASLPSAIVKLLGKYADDPEALRAAGIERAAEQALDLARGGAEGVHIYTMNKPEIAKIASEKVKFP